MGEGGLSVYLTLKLSYLRLRLVEDSVGGDRPYRGSRHLETVTTSGVVWERLCLTLRLRWKVTTKCEAVACYMLQVRYDE